tara:strand:+ start:1510 stop:2184 length:675 start_codon:yes stop_codon:yes gene_type:complete
MPEMSASRGQKVKRTKPIQTQVDRALDALREESWYVAENHLLKALTASRGRDDWEGMIEIIEGLRQCRRGIRRQALVRGSVRICNDGTTETMDISTGRYLVEPPLVGADARKLIQAGRDKQVAIAVVCREPLTQTGLIPIVAIAPGTTIRVQIEPPANKKKPTTAWFKGAMESLGEAALESIDPSRSVDRRIDALMGTIDAIPDHEELYVALSEACCEAHELGE